MSFFRHLVSVPHKFCFTLTIHEFSPTTDGIFIPSQPSTLSSSPSFSSLTSSSSSSSSSSSPNNYFSSFPSAFDEGLSVHLRRHSHHFTTRVALFDSSEGKFEWNETIRFVGTLYKKSSSSSSSSFDNKIYSLTVETPSKSFSIQTEIDLSHYVEENKQMEITKNIKMEFGNSNNNKEKDKNNNDKSKFINDKNNQSVSTFSSPNQLNRNRARNPENLSSTPSTWIKITLKTFEIDDSNRNDATTTIINPSSAQEKSLSPVGNNIPSPKNKTQSKINVFSPSSLSPSSPSPTGNNKKVISPPPPLKRPKSIPKSLFPQFHDDLNEDDENIIKERVSLSPDEIFNKDDDSIPRPIAMNRRVSHHEKGFRRVFSDGEEHGEDSDGEITIDDILEVREGRNNNNSSNNAIVNSIMTSPSSSLPHSSIANSSSSSHSHRRSLSLYPTDPSKSSSLLSEHSNVASMDQHQNVTKNNSHPSFTSSSAHFSPLSPRGRILSGDEGNDHDEKNNVHSHSHSHSISSLPPLNLSTTEWIRLETLHHSHYSPLLSSSLSLLFPSLSSLSPPTHSLFPTYTSSLVDFLTQKESQLKLDDEKIVQKIKEIEEKNIQNLSEKERKKVLEKRKMDENQKIKQKIKEEKEREKMIQKMQKTKQKEEQKREKEMKKISKSPVPSTPKSSKDPIPPLDISKSLSLSHANSPSSPPTPSLSSSPPSPTSDRIHSLQMYFNNISTRYWNSLPISSAAIHRLFCHFHAWDIVKTKEQKKREEEKSKSKKGKTKSIVNMASTPSFTILSPRSWFLTSLLTSLHSSLLPPSSRHNIRYLIFSLTHTLFLFHCGQSNVEGERARRRKEKKKKGKGKGKNGKGKVNDADSDNSDDDYFSVPIIHSNIEIPLTLENRSLLSTYLLSSAPPLYVGASGEGEMGTFDSQLRQLNSDNERQDALMKYYSFDYLSYSGGNDNDNDNDNNDSQNDDLTIEDELSLHLWYLSHLRNLIIHTLTDVINLILYEINMRIHIKSLFSPSELKELGSPQLDLLMEILNDVMDILTKGNVLPAIKNQIMECIFNYLSRSILELLIRGGDKEQGGERVKGQGKGNLNGEERKGAGRGRKEEEKKRKEKEKPPDSDVELDSPHSPENTNEIPSEFLPPSTTSSSSSSPSSSSSSSAPPSLLLHYNSPSSFLLIGMKLMMLIQTFSSWSVRVGGGKQEREEPTEWHKKMREVTKKERGESDGEEGGNGNGRSEKSKSKKGKSKTEETKSDSSDNSSSSSSSSNPKNDFVFSIRRSLLPLKQIALFFLCEKSISTLSSSSLLISQCSAVSSPLLLLLSIYYNSSSFLHFTKKKILMEQMSLAAEEGKEEGEFLEEEKNKLFGNNQKDQKDENQKGKDKKNKKDKQKKEKDKDKEKESDEKRNLPSSSSGPPMELVSTTILGDLFETLPSNIKSFYPSTSSSPTPPLSSPDDCVTFDVSPLLSDSLRSLLSPFTVDLSIKVNKFPLDAIQYGPLMDKIGREENKSKGNENNETLSKANNLNNGNSSLHPEKENDVNHPTVSLMEFWSFLKDDDGIVV